MALHNVQRVFTSNDTKRAKETATSNRLDRLDLEVKRDQREDKALQFVDVNIRELNFLNTTTHPQILYQVVEHAETFRILTVLNIHKGADFCRL